MWRLTPLSCWRGISIFLSNSRQESKQVYFPKMEKYSFKNTYFNPYYTLPSPISSVCLGCNESMRINLTQLNWTKRKKQRCTFTNYHVVLNEVFIMYVMYYIYWIRCGKGRLLRVCQLRPLTADRLERWKHFQNKKNFLVLEKKKEKVKHFTTFSGKEWKTESSLVWRWMQGWGKLFLCCILVHLTITLVIHNFQTH